MIPVVVSVGTTHPLNTAGVGLDAIVVRALGARALTIVAGVSAQDALRVYARMPVDPATIDAQFAALHDIAIDAFCVGALLDARSVLAVAGALGEFPGTPVICDPVIAATMGDRLADDATIAAYGELFPHCTLVTPNSDEAARIGGRPIRDAIDVRAATTPLLALGARAVLIKGGHIAGDAVDVFADGTRHVEFRAPRIAQEMRGTGSLLAAAIATRCAFGDDLISAIESARLLVRERIANAIDFAGMRIAY